MSLPRIGKAAWESRAKIAGSVSIVVWPHPFGGYFAAVDGLLLFNCGMRGPARVKSLDLSLKLAHGSPFELKVQASAPANLAKLLHANRSYFERVIP